MTCPFADKVILDLPNFTGWQAGDEPARRPGGLDGL